MNDNKALWIRIGALAALLAVALGAFGAHALKAHLAEMGKTHIWETAVQYHFLHSLALLFPAASNCKRFQPAAFFLAGIVVFSGSLYVLALTGIGWLGAITPIGGVAFIIGWFRLAFFAKPA